MQFAPRPGQRDSSWQMSSPEARGASALSPGFVDRGKLRLNAAECAPFVSAPVDVSGQTTFFASVKI